MSLKKVSAISIGALVLGLFVVVAKADVYFDDLLPLKDFNFPTQRGVTTSGHMPAVRGTVYGGAEFASTTSNDDINMTFAKKNLFGYDTADRCYNLIPNGKNTLYCNFRSNTKAGDYTSSIIMNIQNDNIAVKGVYHVAKK